MPENSAVSVCRPALVGAGTVQVAVPPLCDAGCSSPARPLATTAREVQVATSTPSTLNLTAPRLVDIGGAATSATFATYWIVAPGGTPSTGTTACVAVASFV